MALRQEDDFPQKPPPSFLDFSRQKITTKDELKSALWKIPDLRMRPDRLWDDEVLCTFKMVDYPFTDPVPVDLRNVRIRDLSQVDIDWKMLTLLRPSSRLDEDVFSRFVQLDRFKLKTTVDEAGTGVRPGFITKTPRGASKMIATRAPVRPASPKDKKTAVEEESTDDTSSISQELINYEVFAREPVDENDTVDLSLGATGPKEATGASLKVQAKGGPQGERRVRRQMAVVGKESRSKSRHRKDQPTEETKDGGKTKSTAKIPHDKKIEKSKEKKTRSSKGAKNEETPKEIPQQQTKIAKEKKSQKKHRRESVAK